MKNTPSIEYVVKI